MYTSVRSKKWVLCAETVSVRGTYWRADEYLEQERPDRRIPHRHQLKEAELRFRQVMENWSTAQRTIETLGRDVKGGGNSGSPDGMT